MNRKGKKMNKAQLWFICEKDMVNRVKPITIRKMNGQGIKWLSDKRG